MDSRRQSEPVSAAGRPTPRSRPRRPAGGRRRRWPTSSSSSTRPGAENPISPPRAARGTVGEGATPVDSTPAAATASPDGAGEALEGFVPLTLEEAQALMTEALTGIDRSALLAERAEAEAQLRAAEATLGISAAAASGPGSEPAAVPAAGGGRRPPAGER